MLLYLVKQLFLQVISGIPMESQKLKLQIWRRRWDAMFTTTLQRRLPRWWLAYSKAKAENTERQRNTALRFCWQKNFSLV